MERFEATIVGARGGGAYVEVPPDVLAALGGKGRIPVRATFDGIDYRGSVVTMGGVRCIGVLKSIRAAIGKGAGDTVVVTLAPDTDERAVEIAADLRSALESAGANGAFAALSYSHQREYVEWIEDAKRPATRERRIGETIVRLTATEQGSRAT